MSNEHDPYIEDVRVIAIPTTVSEPCRIDIDMQLGTLSCRLTERYLHRHVFVDTILSIGVDTDMSIVLLSIALSKKFWKISFFVGICIYLV